MSQLDALFKQMGVESSNIDTQMQVLYFAILNLTKILIIITIYKNRVTLGMLNWILLNLLRKMDLQG